jgi:hypothetical protein
MYFNEPMNKTNPAINITSIVPAMQRRIVVNVVVKKTKRRNIDLLRLIHNLPRTWSAAPGNGTQDTHLPMQTSSFLRRIIIITRFALAVASFIYSRHPSNASSYSESIDVVGPISHDESTARGKLKRAARSHVHWPLAAGTRNRATSATPQDYFPGSRPIGT